MALSRFEEERENTINQGLPSVAPEKYGSKLEIADNDLMPGRRALDISAGDCRQLEE